MVTQIESFTWLSRLMAQQYVQLHPMKLCVSGKCLKTPTQTTSMKVMNKIHSQNKNVMDYSRKISLLDEKSINFYTLFISFFTFY